MSQCKLFEKLIGVAVRGSSTRPLVGLKKPQSRRKGGHMKEFGLGLSASILLFLAVASAPTAAYALDVKIYVNGNPVNGIPTNVVATPGVNDQICPVGQTVPCTLTKGKVVSLNIPAGTYSTSTQANALEIFTGARVEAKVETNNLTIATSASITTMLNVVGTYRMKVAGDLKIEVSSAFNLNPASTAPDLGTWRAAGQGASKCALNNQTGKYDPCSTCTLPSATSFPSNWNSTNPTLCRSYGFTDTGYVHRFNSTSQQWDLPADGVIVTMNSEVTFKNTAGTTTVTKPVVQQLQMTIPPGSTYAAGKFYSTQASQIIPCEPFLEPCATTETKKNTVVFQAIAVNEQVYFPATGTDVGTTDFGVLQAKLHKVEIGIDVHPTDPVLDPSSGFYVAGPNADWNTDQEGNAWILALNTPATSESPEIDVCSFADFDGQGNPLARLSVANSAFQPFLSVHDFIVDGLCIGKRYQFDRGAVNATIVPSPGGTRKEACQKTPSAILIIDDAVTLTTSYSIDSKGNKEGTFEGGPECEFKGGTVICTTSAQATGTAPVKCGPEQGG